VINYGSGSSYQPKLLEMAEKLPSLTVVGLDFYKQETLRYEMDMLGYILNEEERAKEYNLWCKTYEEEIEALVDELEPENKPRVFIAKNGWFIPEPFKHLDQALAVTSYAHWLGE
jgi:ABC-type Fe3+-hydroxamate transport system substrate-binding protein